jgi:hypothetical protein
MSSNLTACSAIASEGGATCPMRTPAIGACDHSPNKKVRAPPSSRLLLAKVRKVPGRHTLAPAAAASLAGSVSRCHAARDQPISSHFRTASGRGSAEKSLHRKLRLDCRSATTQIFCQFAEIWSRNRKTVGCVLQPKNPAEIEQMAAPGPRGCRPPSSSSSSSSPQLVASSRPASAQASYM